MCECSASWEPAEFKQYHAELHKKDFSWQVREDRKNKGRKRPAADANVATDNLDACGAGDVVAASAGGK